MGGSGRQVRFGSGWVHLRRLLLALSAIQSGTEGHRSLATHAHVPLRATEGTTVVLLTPMLTEAIATVAAATARRGLPTLVIDTLPEDAEPVLPSDADPALASLAWRMRKIEREQVLAGLSGLGCPVVAWLGPGTLDEVLQPAGPARAAPAGAPAMSALEWSVSQLVARVVILLGPVVGLFAAAAAGVPPPGWVAALVVALSLGWAFFPESAFGTVVARGGDRAGGGGRTWPICRRPCWSPRSRCWSRTWRRC